MSKFFVIALGIFATLFGVFAIASAAPSFNVFRSLLPETTDTYDLGTSTKEWNGVYTKDITITGTCTGCGGSATLSGGTAGMLTSWATSNTVTATSSPTAAYFWATSTNPSFFKGGFLSTASSTLTSTTTVDGALIANGNIVGYGIFGGATSGGLTITGGTADSALGGASLPYISIGDDTANNNIVNIQGLDHIGYIFDASNPIYFNAMPLTATRYISYPNVTGTAGIGAATTSGSLAYWGGNAGLYAAPTTTASCSGTVSCSGFTILGSSPVTITGSGSGAWPWNLSTNFGTAVNATTTPTWFQNGVFASSTSRFVNATFYSTTTHTGITITPLSTVSNSTSVGGAFNLTNTANGGAGVIVYSNFGSGASGRLMNVRCDNSLFDQDCLHIDQDGTQNGLSIISTNGQGISVSQSGNNHGLVVNYTGTGSNDSSANFTSTNVNGSSVQITGAPNGLGILKVSANGAGNNSSAVLSLDATTNSFNGQGIFTRCNSATSTYCLVLKDASSNVIFSVDGNSLVTMTNASSTAFSATTLCLTGDTCITSWPSGSGSPWPFTASTNFGSPVQSTSTLWLTSGLQASSTSQIENANFWGTVGIGTSTPGSILSIQNVANFVASAISTFYNGLRVLTELIIPTSTAPSLSNSGDIAINTTSASSSVTFNDGTAQRYLYPEKTITFNYATSTPAGTTTIQLMGSIRQQTYTQMGCVATGGTANVQIGTGSASTTMVTASSLAGAGSGTFTTLSSNNTFNKGQAKYISIGTFSANTITQISCSIGVRDEL